MMEAPALIGVLGVVVGLVGIGVALRSRRVKAPVWAVRTASIATSHGTGLMKLTVLYEDRSVERVSVSKLAIWNAGSDTIDGSDCSKEDPLRLVAASGIMILDVDTLSCSSPASRVSLRHQGDGGDQEGSVELGFEFLDPQQGSMLQIVHTGESHAPHQLDIKGTLRGARPFERVTPSAPLRMRERVLATTGATLFVVLFALFPLSLLVTRVIPALQSVARSERVTND